MNSARREEWVVELLVDEATQGLCDQDQRELENLLDDQPMPHSERYGFLQAATALELAFCCLESEPQPDKPPSVVVEFPISLTQRLAILSQRHVSSGGLEETSQSADPAPFTRLSESRTLEVRLDRKQRVFPAWLAAAAALALAAIAWWPRLVTSIVERPDSTLVATASFNDTDYGLVLDLVGTEDPAGVAAQGRLLWDAIRQEGVMRISGLEVNDPNEYQYQLWIFDLSRDERHPVDGGVFDMRSEADEGLLSIPIDAHLRIEEPTLFVITVERPGGVVVSDRERIVMVASAV